MVEAGPLPNPETKVAMALPAVAAAVALVEVFLLFWVLFLGSVTQACLILSASLPPQPLPVLGSQARSEGVGYC